MDLNGSDSPARHLQLVTRNPQLVTIFQYSILPGFGLF